MLTLDRTRIVHIPVICRVLLGLNYKLRVESSEAVNDTDEPTAPALSEAEMIGAPRCIFIGTEDLYWVLKFCGSNP